MDAIEYINEKNRLCKYYKECEICPLGREADCVTFENDYPKKCVYEVEEWSKAHPKSKHTYYDEFYKRFSKICVNEIFGTNYNCDIPCEQCWDKEYKGD